MTNKRKLTSPYLAVAAIVKDEAAHIEEWIAFHQVVGVEQFFIYDNGSTDGTAELLEGREGVTVYDWPGERQQLYAYANALLHHESQWIAFLDADEFLFSPSYAPLPTVLRDYERYDAVGACWAVFGTAGIEHRQPNLLGSGYVRRATQHDSIHRHVKSIVQPKRVAQQTPHDPHHFDCTRAVDEQERPLLGPLAQSTTWQHLRINHYMSRSIDEARNKMTQLRADNGERRSVDLCSDAFNAEFDNTIESYASVVDARMQHG